MRAFIQKSALAVVAAVGLGMGTVNAQAQDSHYVILFAFDGTPRAPRVSHTFAVFVKAPSDQGDPSSARLEAYPISWSTARPNTRLLFAKRPDSGVNLDLPATFELSASMNTQVSALGPYQIKKELFDRAGEQYARLNSGTVSYKMIDNTSRRARDAVNCIHAVSDIVPGPLLKSGTAFGIEATTMVRNHMAPWFVDDGGDHTWLIDRLGLRDYPITFVPSAPSAPPLLPKLKR